MTFCCCIKRINNTSRSRDFLLLLLLYFDVAQYSFDYLNLYSISKLKLLLLLIGGYKLGTFNKHSFFLSKRFFQKPFKIILFVNPRITIFIQILESTDSKTSVLTSAY